MTKEGWRQLIVEAANDSTGERLTQLAQLLEEVDMATQYLHNIGYGWQGLGLLATVLQITTIGEKRGPDQ
jgi:hypothetical protein